MLYKGTYHIPSWLTIPNNVYSTVQLQFDCLFNSYLIRIIQSN